MPDRRAFLSGLAILPLIGGSVALIGKPTALAAPVNDRLLATYDEWLDMERSWLLWQRFGRDARFNEQAAPLHVVWRDKATGMMKEIHHVPVGHRFDYRNAASRAAIVLATVGHPLT